MDSWFFWGLNFSPRVPSYLSDELIVSRFSSLSGCLNPKVKAFLPPVYIPFTGGFLFGGLLKPVREQVATLLYSLSRNARKERHHVATQPRTHVAKNFLLRAAAELVRLREKHEKLRIAEPGDELLVQRCQRMTRIHDEHDAGERPRR